MFVLNVVFPVEKKRYKKPTESLIRGKLHPFSREAKWSLPEFISPHLFIFSSAIIVQQLPFHWNGSALPLEIKALLDKNSKCFLHVALRRRIPLFIKQGAEANQTRIPLGCMVKEIKGNLLVSQVVLIRGMLRIYSFSLTNPIRMSPQWKTPAATGILGSAETQRPCQPWLWPLATLIFSIRAGSSVCKSKQTSWRPYRNTTLYSGFQTSLYTFKYLEKLSFFTAWKGHRWPKKHLGKLKKMGNGLNLLKDRLCRSHFSLYFFLGCSTLP